jgi:hypothetical protein
MHYVASDSILSNIVEEVTLDKLTDGETLLYFDSLINIVKSNHAIS